MHIFDVILMDNSVGIVSNNFFFIHISRNITNKIIPFLQTSVILMPRTRTSKYTLRLSSSRVASSSSLSNTEWDNKIKDNR